jgi:hypothetical protein
MVPGNRSLYGNIVIVPRASEQSDPRDAIGAETPSPRKDRNDSRKMADGICRQVVITS